MDIFTAELIYFTRYHMFLDDKWIILETYSKRNNLQKWDENF